MIKEYRDCVFVVVYSGSKFLLLRRKWNWKGWEFCKGGIRKNETKEKAAKREVSEETGQKVIKLKKLDIQGSFPYSKKLWKQKQAKKAKYSLFLALVKKGKVKISRKEHDNYKWASYKEALKLLTWKNQKKCLKSAEKFLRIN